jgi:hypothetical protein
MSKQTDTLAVVIRSLTISLILFSILVTYYVKVAQTDYVIFTNPDGPETEDYFAELYGE